MEYKGNPVSHGIAVGEIHLYTPFVPVVEEKFISPEETEQAVKQYLDLREKAKAELEAIQEKFKNNDSDKAKIFAAHADILFDKVINEEIQDNITCENMSPEWAIQKTYDKFARLLSKSKDELIRERIADLQDLRIRLHRIWFGVPEKNLSMLEKPVVVAAYDLMPSDTATLDREKVRAIITEIGGSTSHSAIIARSYEIPAILGIPGLMNQIEDGELVIVDAVEGTLLTQTNEAQRKLYAKKGEDFLIRAADLKKHRDKQPVTQDGVRIDVHLNIGSVTPDELAGSRYTDGVGLFRTEFMYMSNAGLPSEDEQFKQYRKVAIEFGQRPLILRTLDIGGDKQSESLDLPDEQNPFLGLRALRLCLDNPALFKTQLRAAFRAACYGNLWIMFPMVGSLDDIRNAKAIVEDVKKSLAAEGVQHNPDVKIGIMIEIPSIAIIADMAAKEVDFASLGTNDLCQYLTATDRLNPNVSQYYQIYHPSMFRLIERTVAAFKAEGKPIGVCGEMGGDPLAAAVLIGLGLRKLSMGAASIAGIKKMITGLTIPRAEALAQEVLTLSTASEVEHYLKKELKALV